MCRTNGEFWGPLFSVTGLTAISPLIRHWSRWGSVNHPHLSQLQTNRSYYQSLSSQSLSTMRPISPVPMAAGARVLFRESRVQHTIRRYGTVSPFPLMRSSAFDNALAADSPRNTWAREEIKEIYDTPLMNLAFAAVCQTSSICPVDRCFLTRGSPGHCPQEIS